MTKTENFNLNKPEAVDPMRLEDFNQNADIIDGLLGSLIGKASVVVGSFAGTGVGGRTLELGFTPKFILILSEYNGKGYITMATAQAGWYIDGETMILSGSRCVEGGVHIVANTSNSASGGNYYVAVY